MTRHILFLLSALLLAFSSLLPGFAQAQRASPVEVDRVVAVVNDEVITLQELRSRLTAVERQLRKQNVPLPAPAVLKKQMIDRMIIDRVQLQYANTTGITTTDADLDMSLRRIADSNQLSLPAFRTALESDGLNWRQFREEVRNEITLSRLRDREVNSRVSIADGEIDNYLKNPDSVAQSGAVEVNISHIILRVPESPTPDQLMRIGARAQAALDQVQRGEDFAKVAASYSEAPDGLSGGSLGMRPLDRLPSLYAEVAKKLQPGEVSSILRSPAGFHIIKLIEKRSSDTNPLGATVKQTHARHILIKVNELVSAADAEHKMLSIKERLDNGADFAELARLYSNDFSSSKGGDLGWLYPGDTVPEFEKAMDALEVNEVSAPVQSPFGFHLIQVLERRTGDISQERQRMIARQVLRDRKADEAYQDWVRQLRDRAYVEYRLEE